LFFYLKKKIFFLLDLTNGQSSSPPPPPPPDDDNPEGYSLTKQPDAYCNLCERSFCNKYFLKTHFAKKHGALNLISPSTESNESPSPPPPPPSSSSLPNLSIDQPLPLIVNQKINEDYCEVCLKKKIFCFKNSF
jgi:hypothetical protein